MSRISNTWELQGATGRNLLPTAGLGPTSRNVSSTHGDKQPKISTQDWQEQYVIDNNTSDYISNAMRVCIQTRLALDMNVSIGQTSRNRERDDSDL